jgi:hypothetical protein
LSQRVEGARRGLEDAGFRVQGVVSRMQGLGCKAWSRGCRV